MDLLIGSKGRKGADGLAFWYTKDRMEGGNVFGSKDNWEGLGIFFDSFDNDYKRNNPSIYAIVNDGSKSFDHNNDGGSDILGQCSLDYRNTKIPFNVKIRYVDGALELFTDRSGQKNWVLCFQAPISIPSGYHFGLSAATGELSDQHAIHSFTAYSFENDEFEPQREEESKEFIENMEKEEQEKVVAKPKSVVNEDVEKPTKTSDEDGLNIDILKKLESILKDDKKDKQPSGVGDSNIEEVKVRLDKIEETLTQYIESFTSFQKLLTEALQNLLKSGKGTTTTIPLEQVTAEISNVAKEIEKLKVLLKKPAATTNSDSPTKKEFNTLTTQVNTIKSTMSNIRNDITAIANTLSSGKASSSGDTLGFWVYILLFQVLFFLAFIFYKKMKDSKDKLY